jgi:hypothetical protein
MIDRMEMPAGVIGLRATGKLTRDDYRQALERPCARRRMPATSGWSSC